MNDEELLEKLATAFSLIAKLAHATDVILGRLVELETRVAKLEADAALRKARGP